MQEQWAHVALKFALEMRSHPHPTEIQMNKNQIEGTIKDIAGKVQRSVGTATDNTKQQVKGAAKQIEGKFQKGVGDVEQAVDDSAKGSADTH
jgi:uncharacterized protein YjbJ (UPF0337 family)